MRILVTGAKGQLGLALQSALAGHEVLASDLPELDITNYAATLAAIAAFRPDHVIHAAAYTNVDGCELDSDGAYAVNALGTQYVALAARSVGAALTYISTNCVFDGRKETPYLEFDDPAPLSVYGHSKLAGERIVQSLMDRYYIVRTAWLYGDGPRNFVKTVVRLLRDHDTVQMVADEVSSPTYAKDLALGLAKLIQVPAYGFYHLTNEGFCSRYDFTAEIARLIGRGEVGIEPIRLCDYERPARPPLRSPLRNYCAAKLGIRLRPWQEALGEYLCSSQ